MWQAAVARHNVSGMCNLYSMTKGQQAIREFTRATRDTAGNLPPLPGIFPDGMAPSRVQRRRRRARGYDDAMGYALPASVWHNRCDKYPQHRQPALAALAWSGEPVPGAGDIVL